MQPRRLADLRRALLPGFLGLLVLLGACRGPQPPAAVTIDSFTATPSAIAAGETSTLAWEVSGAATSIALTSGGDVVAEDLAATGSFDVTPLQTTEYTLVVTDEGEGEVTESVTVTVSAAPEVTIAAFAATPPTIAPGASSTLSWEVTGDVEAVTSISLQSAGAPVAEDLEASGTFAVTPSATTEYTLVVTLEGAEDVTATATVTVSDNPPVGVTIDSFNASPATIVAGDPSTLSWTVSGDLTALSSISLQSGGTSVADDLSATGTFEVSPTATTQYTLVVSVVGATEPLTATATVNVTPAPAPTIASFSADPATVAPGGTSTLSWVVVGRYASISLMTGDDLVQDGLAATGSFDVTPAATTEYTLVVAPLSGGDDVTRTATVTVQAPVGSPTITSAAAEVTVGSQFTVTWVATDADTFDVVAVNPSNPEDTATIPGGTGIPGTETSATLPIPDSTHQLIRVIASNTAGDAQRDAGQLANVVLNTQDYDPYDPDPATEPSGEAPIAGSFRQVLSSAPSGAVIGFAADVVTAGTILLPGVQLAHYGAPTIDAHIFVNKDVTISAPDTGITFEGVSGRPPAGPGTDFSWRSRVLYVDSGATVVLDNITLTGGTFIYAGAGVRNLGDLTMNGGAVTGNRAWHTGGGIHNSGTLVLNGTLVSDNSAATHDDEVDQTIAIRGNPTYTTGDISVGGWGGGIYNDGGTVTLNDATIQDNDARFTGGGVANDDGGTVVVTTGSIEGNEASDADYTGSHEASVGGGVYSVGTLTMTGVSVSGNDALNIGGGLGVSVPGTATVTGGSFSSNTADYSGAIHVWYCSTGTPADVLTLDPATTFTGNDGRLADDNTGSTGTACPVAPTSLRPGESGRSPFLPSLDVLEQGKSR